MNKNLCLPRRKKDRFLLNFSNLYIFGIEQRKKFRDFMVFNLFQNKKEKKMDFTLRGDFICDCCGYKDSYIVTIPSCWLDLFDGIFCPTCGTKLTEN